MKKYKKTFIFYSAVMFLILPIAILAFKTIDISVLAPASYSDEEIVIYKKIWNSMNGSIDEAKNRMLILFIVLWVVILLLGYILLFFIYSYQIKPVLELQGFATEISKGNLDIQLPISRNNGFVNLTESFDIMRIELKDAKQREIDAENAKRELVAELSHDLKTPIATIQATCEVLNAQFAIKKQKILPENLPEIESLEEKIGFITKKAEIINELIQSVFKATVDDMAEIKVSVDEYSSLMIEDYFKGLKEYGNIILDNHIPECLVYMDKLRMEQVVDNIVGNSYKYAGTDVHVSFNETEEITAENGRKIKYIQIIIRDSGPGVSEADLPLLTEKFYRGNNSKEKNGYGLGLYLVKNYMERQGGGFEYYNDKGFVAELFVLKV